MELFLPDENLISIRFDEENQIFGILGHVYKSADPLS
jgi:hypothetical protein